MNSFAKFVALLVLAIVAMLPRVAGPAALKTKGLWVQFEERGVIVQWWPGQVIQLFNTFDSGLGHNVSDEVALQLDKMHAMGVNTITIELRSADSDGNNIFPICHVHPSLGFQWPQPTQTELGNVVPFFDLIHSKGLKVILVLVNMHMEEQPSTNSQTWLGAILNQVKNHPALDFVVFNGDAHTVDTNGDGQPDACGIQAEAPLWLGATAYAGTYVQWAIGYAMNSLGMPASKLSSGEVIGDYFVDSGAACGQNCTGGHLWKPYVVMKTIFDNLSVPANQRVYALSFYEHRKCLTARFLQCTEADPPTWADQTMQNVYNAIGADIGARVVAYEMGNNNPLDPATNWSTPNALANLVAVLKKYGADGGSFYRWVNFQTSEDSNPTVPQPIKLRGVAFNYTPVKTALVQAYKPPAHDLNGDGVSDILFRNTGGGIATWLMGPNATIQSAVGVGSADPSVWTIIGQRDINGDGNADIILRAADGSIGEWLMNANGTILSANGLGNPTTNWKIVGTGDFNGDGIGDILWYHTSGAVGIWYMNSSGGLLSAVGVGTLPLQWSIAGTGDFDGDGVWDMLWYHTSGAVAVWLMNSNSTIKSAVGLGSLPVGTWNIAGTGDFDGDGISDILLSASGNAVGIWFMNSSGTISSAVGVGTMAPGWSLAETGDYNGDGKSDILWYHAASGSIGAWLLNGASIASAVGIGSLPPASWSVVTANAD